MIEDLVSHIFDPFLSFYHCYYLLIYLAPNKKAGSELFTPTEDALLLIGVQNYGPNNFGIIQEKLFPMLTPQQLAHRFKV